MPTSCEDCMEFYHKYISSNWGRCRILLDYIDIPNATIEDEDGRMVCGIPNIEEIMVSRNFCCSEFNERK